MDNTATSYFLSRYRIVLHVLFWAGLVCYESVVLGVFDEKYHDRFMTSLAELPVKMIATYFTLYVLIDKFFLRKNYKAFVVLLGLSMICSGILFRLTSYYLVYPTYYPEGTQMPFFFLPKILILIFVTYSLVAIVASFHLIKHYYKHQQEAQQLLQTTQQLEKEKLAAELKLLRSQINPHFLFNTLNNLYVLTLNQSEKAPGMVHQLSQLMSYMLYDSNQSEVPLDKEIQYIKNYIDLEKLRYGDRLEVTLSVYEKTQDIVIAPLLILPFVENSFKHGASHQLEHGWIHIDIEIQENTLVLKVENSKPGFAEEQKTFSGIGLQNVTKRLHHLYPDRRHSLQCFDEADTYLAVLRLSLNGAPVSISTTEEEMLTG